MEFLCFFIKSIRGSEITMKRKERIEYLEQHKIPALEQEYYNSSGTGQIYALNELVKAEDELKKLKNKK